MIQEPAKIIYNGLSIDGYIIYKDGRVFSEKRNIFLKDRTHSGGYRCVTLWTTKQKDCFIHRIVACSFLPNPLNKRCINHIDGDKTNNNVSNLEWCTDSENQYHSHSKGLHCFKGERNNLSKLSDIEFVIIRSCGLPTSFLSKEYGVSSTCINDIKSRKSWKHI